MVSQEYPFVMWMDASIRFLSSDLEPMFDKARKFGVVLMPCGGSIAMRTHPSTFKHLGELPCTFKDTHEFQGTFVLLYLNSFVREHFMKPLVSCALTPGCILPMHNHRQYLNCGKYGEVYHACHRFDQSVIGILTYRLFYNELDNHVVPGGILHIYRDEFYTSDYWKYFIGLIV